MAIDTKPKSDKPQPLVFRDNLEVKKKIEAHKTANPSDVIYYTRLVRENPERAIDSFILRDVQKRDNEMRLITKQLPNAKAFYDNQPADVKLRIDEALRGVEPYFKDKEFVAEVVRERERQFRRELASPTPPATGPKIAA